MDLEQQNIKLLSEIKRLHNENDNLVKSHRKEVQELNNKYSNISKDYYLLKKKCLELIKENNKLKECI